MDNSTTNLYPHNQKEGQIFPSYIVPESEIKDSLLTEQSRSNSENKNLLILEYREKIVNYEERLKKLEAALQQKEDIIILCAREKSILEQEKNSLKKESELAIKEKEKVVIHFATKEKSLLDAKKEKDLIDKLYNEAKKEVKNITFKFQALNEEKNKIAYMLEDKCNDIKKIQKEFEKCRTDLNNLEMKLKWNNVKLNQEIESKLIAEKKLEEKCSKPEEKESEQKRMENEASLILLKHEIDYKEKLLANLNKEIKELTERNIFLQASLSKEIKEKTKFFSDLENLRSEHTSVQNSLSQEMLISAKLRSQLKDFKVLQTKNTLNEDEIRNINYTNKGLQQQLQDCNEDIAKLRYKEMELLNINRELSELNAKFQNDILLQTSKVKAIAAESEIIKKEKNLFDTKYNDIATRLRTESEEKNEERLLLTKHLSEKTKLYESTKIKLENVTGDLEATKKKHSQIFKELNREIHKYKKLCEEKSSNDSHNSREELSQVPQCVVTSQHSDSESDVQSNSSIQEPSTQHLVSRILRLQQASARQTEKIDFLENHTMSLVCELQKKSKLIQYYMIRDQAGALTSIKSDENKTELAKYGGVMSAIYSGIKGTNQTSMTLDLSLEINKKLQAVLEDTLLKNITLKENLDVLGLEVDKLSRELSQKNEKT